MKKKIFVIAILSVLTASTSLFAQKTESKECKELNCERGDSCCMKIKYNPFSDLNLTAEQQTKLDNLRQEMKKDRKDAVEKMKADKDKNRKAKKEAMENGRKAYLAKVKEILTPEQYVQFLENSFLNANKAGMKNQKMKAHGPRDAKKGGPRPGGKQGKKDGKRPERPAKQ